MRSAKCGMKANGNGNSKGKDLNRKGRQERKGRQRMFLWKEEAWSLFAFFTFFAVDAVAFQPGTLNLEL